MKAPPPTTLSMHWLTLLFLALAFAIIQALIGGAKLVYSFPAYLVFGLAGLVTLKAAFKTDLPKPNRLCIATALALAGYVCIRSFLSPVAYLARTDLFMVIGSLLVYLITTVFLTNANKRQILLWALFAFAVAHILVGVIQFAQGNNYMLLPWIFRPNYGRRASGFYICPNHIAGLFEMLALIAASITYWGRGRPLTRIIAGYMSAMCLAGIAITGSRGGYLSIIVGAVAFVSLSLFAIKKIRRKQFIVFLIAAIVSVGGVLSTGLYLLGKSYALQARVDNVYDPQNMRIYLWKAALQQFALQPLVGTGSATYLSYGRHFRDVSVQNDPVHVHDDYLELLAEYGIVGAVLMAAFLGAHFTNGLRAIPRIVRGKMKKYGARTSNDLALDIGALSALTALLAHSVTDFNLHIPANTLFVAFLFGILAHPTRTAAKAKDEDEAPVDGIPAWLRFAPATLSLMLIGSVIRLMPGEYFAERARVSLRDSGYAEAANEARTALEAEKKNPDIYFTLGEAQHYLALQAKTPEEIKTLQESAISSYLAGLRIFPDDLRLQLKLSRTLDLMGRYDEAEPVLEKAIAFDPNFGNVYAYYGLHFHLQRRFKRAERYYRKAQSISPDEISTQGLKDIDKDRKIAAENDVLGNFVTNRDDEDDDDDGPVVVPVSIHR